MSLGDRYVGSWELLRWITLGCSFPAVRGRTCGWTWGTESPSRWTISRRADYGSGWSSLWSLTSFCRSRQGTYHVHKHM